MAARGGDKIQTGSANVTYFIYFAAYSYVKFVSLSEPSPFSPSFHRQKFVHLVQ